MKFQLLYVTCGLLLLAATAAHGRSIFEDEDEETSDEDFGGLISRTLKNGVRDILARFEDDDSSASSSSVKASDVPKAAVADEKDEKVDEKKEEEEKEEEGKEKEEKPSSSSKKETIMDNLSTACTQVETLLQGAVTQLQKSFKSLMESLSLGGASNGDDKDEEDDKDDKDDKKQPAKEQHKKQVAAKQDDKVGDNAGFVGGVGAKATKSDVGASVVPPVAAAPAAGATEVDAVKSQIAANAAGSQRSTANKDDKVSDEAAVIEVDGNDVGDKA